MANESLKDLQARRASSKPARSYLWRVVLPDLRITNALVPVHADAVAALQELASDQHMNVSARINTMTTPYRTFESQQAMDKNGVWNYAGKHNTPEITIEVFEEEDGSTLHYFDTWMKLIRNVSDDTYNPPAIYKNPIVFIRMDTQRQDFEVTIYEGYFIQTINEVSNEYEGNDLVRYQVNLVGDNIIHHRISNNQQYQAGLSPLQISPSLRQTLTNNIGDAIKKIAGDAKNLLP